MDVGDGQEAEGIVGVMVAYRFCRPDDTPLLLRAVNECFDPHFPEQPPLTLEAFQAEVRELDVWPSNCMVARCSAGPIAVCIAAKRAKEVLVYRLATHPDYLRQQHAQHVLTSLSRKLAVLGPSRLVAEVPAENETACLFFRSLGYQDERTCADFCLKTPVSAVEDSELITPVTLQQLLDDRVFVQRSNLCWERQIETLKNRIDQISGYAIVSPDRVEAYVLSRKSDKTEIVAADCFDPALEGTLISILLRYSCRPDLLPVFFPKVSPEEVSWRFLQGLGFEKGQEYILFSAVAEAK